MRILLADDQADVRSALRLVIEHEGCEVVAECERYSDVPAAIAAAVPCLLLLDWELPGWAELPAHRKRRAVATLRQRGGCTRVVALSGRPEARAEAAAAGADGFVSKVDPKGLLDLLKE